MRVLHLYSGNLFGGIEMLLALLARKRGLCPTMEPVFALCYTGRLADELAATGSDVHQLGTVRVAKPMTILRARRALRRLVDTERFDVVVSHGPWVSGVFGPVLRQGAPPLVEWLHSPRTDSWVDRWGRRTRPRLVVCNSRYTASTESSVTSDTRVEWLYPPVDVTPPVADHDGRRTLRRDLHTPDDAVVVLQASRMQSLKGHRVHLEALARLNELPNWVLWFVGGAQRPFEVSYVDELKADAQRLGIAHRVRFAGERCDVARVMAAADIYCQPNTAPEAFGMVFVEALVAGLPVVAGDDGGPPEVVDSSCGLLVPPGDVDALAVALCLLIRDPASRRRLGRHGPRRARELCDPATQLPRLSELLRQVVSP